MTQTKFTPGPWAPEKAGYLINEDDGGTVAEVFWDTRTGTRQQQYLEADANAHLIAAAPELYEAGEEPERRLRQCAENIRDEFPYWARDLEKMADQLAVALAKARGEQS